MANIIPFSFRGALFQGQHNFANSGGNTFKLSLYVEEDHFHTQQQALYTQLRMK